MRWWTILLVALVACRKNDADGDGYVIEVDCNDVDANIHPNAPELCDGADQDCDQIIDEEGTDGATFYEDDDGDGFGDDDTKTGCEAPEGYVADGGDCDDLLDSINPGETERCNTIDDNCDGEVDESTASDAEIWYVDEDGDGYGAGEPITACELDGGVQNDEDCDDTSDKINPDGFEACDSVDNDCDGKADQDAPAKHYEDTDEDTFGDPDTEQELCGEHEGWVTVSDDCDDTARAVNPDADEKCNGIDDDCDDVTDPATSVDAKTWYNDGDGDGVGAGTSFQACDAPDASLVDGDCDDADGHITPGEPDICSEGVDRNCDDKFDGCDLCHPYEPVSDVVWEKDFDVEFSNNNNGTEVQQGGGASGQSFKMETVLSAGAYAWDITSFTTCDTNGNLMQVKSEGTFVDPVLGTHDLVATNTPARQVLPKYDQVGTGATWTFDYDLMIESGGGEGAVPTVGSSTEDDLESITVPAGTFMAWKITSSYTQDFSEGGGELEERESEFWYVEGLGLVKEHTVDGDGAIVIDKVLTDYTGL
jgi:hypothetical protein